MSNPWKLKQVMCEIGRRMYDRGLVSAFEGNLSARLAPDRLLCTPSLMCKGFLKPEDLCVVDMSGRQLSGERKRSSEIYLHLGIYRERPEAQAVVHTHAPHATAFSVTHTPVPNCVTGEVEVFLGEVPLAPYATAGSEQMGEVVANVLRDANPTESMSSNLQGEAAGAAARGASPQAIAPGQLGLRANSEAIARPPLAILLANHGVVSWGKSLEEALHRTEILDSYCRTLILASQIGTPKRLSDQNMRDLMALKKKLGLPDRRAAQQSFQDCDLCGNNLFGRGFSQACTDPRTHQSAGSPTQQTSGANESDIETIVSEITDRVWRALQS